MVTASNHPVVLLDTGPLVAILSRNDQAHAWAKTQFAMFPAPFLTCEAVISEACFVLRKLSGGARGVLALLESGAVQIEFNLAMEAANIRKLLDRYHHVPGALADVCLVRMSELHERCLVLSLDSDFQIYRRHGRQTIPLSRPE
jgi:predicted nucleic acid-binding protein